MGIGDIALAFRREEVLHIDFDSNTKGDSDARILDRRLVRAAKPYKAACFPCGGDIAANELHRVERGLMDGRVGNCRTCQTCCLTLVSDDNDAIEARYTLGRQRAEERRKGQQ